MIAILNKQYKKAIFQIKAINIHLEYGAYKLFFQQLKNIQK